MKRASSFLTAAAAAGALTLAGLAWAQPGGMGYGPGHGMGRGFSPGGGWMPAAGVGSQVSNRLATLKAELKITADQDEAWNAYAVQTQQQAEAVQALRQKMHEQMLSGQVAPGSGEFQNVREAMFKLQQAGAEARAAKVKALYAVLTPTQKAVADRSLGAWGPGGGWGPGRGGGRCLS